jgi:hypothetical protein
VCACDSSSPTPAVNELNTLSDAFASPQLFTNALHGTVLGLYALNARTSERAALRVLRRAQHSYTSQASYYEMIAKLYYLDDDFNDRELQTRHVWQMMTADLTRALSWRLQARVGDATALQGEGTAALAGAAQ